jgi:succinate dehydrogenase / fumarate reductase flavoprotein subunit
VKAGRGSPHGGVFLDIAWIKEKLPNAEEHIKRKLPSMYHQFMQLAGIDITKEPMEIGPTTHYVMGGIRVDGDTQMSTIPGLFACGECAAGLHGANRLGGNSLSDLIVFGKRAGEFAAQFAKSNGAVTVDGAQVEKAANDALAPFGRDGSAEGPYQVQEALQETMQDNVGIVRAQAEMEGALRTIGDLKRRAANAPVKGNREYNPGWHTALDLNNLLTVSEAVARCALERKESRGGHFRDDYPDKSAEYATFNFVVRKGQDGEMQISREAIPPMPEPLKAVIEEMK